MDIQRHVFILKFLFFIRVYVTVQRFHCLDHLPTPPHGNNVSTTTCILSEHVSAIYVQCVYKHSMLARLVKKQTHNVFTWPILTELQLILVRVSHV